MNHQLHQIGTSLTALCLSIWVMNTLPYTNGVPLTYTINRWAKECLYDKLEEDEYLTGALFIAHGSPLKANLIIEGPVSPLTAEDTAKDINANVIKYNAGKRFHTDTIKKDKRQFVNKQGVLYVEDKVDFENYEYADGVDDEDDGYDDSLDDKAIQERDYKKAVRDNAELQRAQREEGEPHLRTVQVASAGWYRVCTNAVNNEVIIEMDMRKSSENGELDERGHVPSLETVVELSNPVFVGIDAAKEQDLDKAKGHIKDLHKLLIEIKSRQQKERHRLENHQEINLHSHSRMVVGSLMETALFIAVTGFQVVTIRKWFSGGPLLGR